MEKLKLKEKFGYGFGCFASSMCWKMSSVFAVQTKEIRRMLSFIPAIGAFVSAMFIYFYTLDDTLMVNVNNELTERRSKAL